VGKKGFLWYCSPSSGYSTGLYPDHIDIYSGQWIELSPEITEILEHTPAQFYVRRIVRHVYAIKDKRDKCL